jgi:PPM family protein phosphatase
MQCPTCHFEQPSSNRFCEECGAKVSEPATSAVPNGAQTCPHCGAIFTGDFCFKCGLERNSVVENHLEISISNALGGVSDVGRLRHRNEDFFALGSTTDVDVLVVCDGVSKSQQPDKAAQAAATLVHDGLLKCSSKTDVELVMMDLLREADAAIRALPIDAGNPEDPPQTTIVAAVRHGNQITIGWLGDSRAYWLDPANMRQLTTDHSWANEVVTAGEMTLEKAMQHRNSHGITRTLGGTANAPADEPAIVQVEITAPGWLLLCTDGFWDSQKDPTAFERFVLDRIASQIAGDNAMKLAWRLVEDACASRGHDNTTVAVLAVNV